jgi:hypothetical protein
VEKAQFFLKYFFLDWWRRYYFLRNSFWDWWRRYNSFRNTFGIGGEGIIFSGIFLGLVEKV